MNTPPRPATEDDRFFVIDYSGDMEDFNKFLENHDLSFPSLQLSRKIGRDLYLVAYSNKEVVTRAITTFNDIDIVPRMPSYYELPAEVTGEVDFAPFDVYTTEFELQANLKGPDRFWLYAFLISG